MLNDTLFILKRHYVKQIRITFSWGTAEEYELGLIRRLHFNRDFMPICRQIKSVIWLGVRFKTKVKLTENQNKNMARLLIGSCSSPRVHYGSLKEYCIPSNKIIDRSDEIGWDVCTQAESKVCKSNQQVLKYPVYSDDRWGMRPALDLPTDSRTKGNGLGQVESLLFRDDAQTTNKYESTDSVAVPGIATGRCCLVTEIKNK